LNDAKILVAEAGYHVRQILNLTSSYCQHDIVDQRWEVFPYGTLTEKAYQAEKIAASITILSSSYFACQFNIQHMV